MDPRLNPYAPGAGTKPPALVGRDEQIGAFDILLERLEHGYTEQSMIITGLRGVGKTVLLDVFREKAELRDWASIEWEIDKESLFVRKLSAQVRRALLQLAPKARWSERLHRAAAILKSFTITFNPDGAITAGLDTEALDGVGDSGVLAEDLTDLLKALGEAAKEHGTGVIFLLDEIQYLRLEEFQALIAAFHRCTRRSLPITLVGAGLPSILRLAGDAKTYSERLFLFPEIGALDLHTSAREAIIQPAESLNVSFQSEAVDVIIEYTQGYPYFLQEFGKIIWDEASESPILESDARLVIPMVDAKLDESFFHVRAERSTDLELRYLYAMSEMGPSAHRARDVALRMKRDVATLGPIRTRLISKGLLYTPSRGYAAFTVPQFDRYMLRCHSDLSND